MVVDATTLAAELRRRRLGRPELLHSLDGARRSTWLPGELHQVPTPLLMLAAMSLARQPGPSAARPFWEA